MEKHNSENPIAKLILSDGGEMLEHPLLDADGQINPICVGELLNALDAPMQRPADPEWDDKKDRWTTRKDIVGAFAKWACRQSPYGVPDGLENVCKYLYASLASCAKWDTAGMCEASLREIEGWLQDILLDQGVKEFDAWNERKNKREGHSFVSRHSSEPHPDDDFIDLDALLRNTVVTIRNERREFKAFNDNFEREHGKLDVNEA